MFDDPRLCSTSALFASAFMSDTDPFQPRALISEGESEKSVSHVCAARGRNRVRRLLIGANPPDVWVNLWKTGSGRAKLQGCAEFTAIYIWLNFATHQKYCS